MTVAAFMRECEFDEATARSNMSALIKELKDSDSDLRRDYIPALKTRDGIPPACGAVLEREDGTCARDKKGNPICVCYGMFEADTRSGILQMNAVMKRVQTHFGPSEIPHVLYVMDLAPREGLHKTTAPDLEFLKYCSKFPQTFTFVVCGATPSFRRAWDATKMLMPEWVRSNYIVDDGYAELAKRVDPSNMLPSWSEKGTFSFDIDSYAEWLAKTAT